MTLRGKGKLAYVRSDYALVWQKTDRHVSKGGKIRPLKNYLRILGGTESVPCHEIKRLFTRVAENTGIRNLPLDGQSFDVFDIRGQKIRHNATSFDNLPKGVYIINGRKVIR